MPRRPRADAPGSWHHIINRGLSKRALFEEVRDARFFLARLVRQVRLGRLKVHAYSVLTTHFHLLVESPLGELSEAMRRAQNEHSRQFNRSRRRDGALVRGRFFSRRVRSLDYRRTLIRYIDANPVRAGLVHSSGDYDLGSAAAYLGRTRHPWLSREWVQAEACRLANEPQFSPAAYRAAFGPPDRLELAEIQDLIDARLERPAREEPFDSLVLRAPSDVRAWMQRKASLADGHRVGLPVCGRLALRRALDQEINEQGVWMVEDGPRTWRGAEIAWHGLLHDLCGLSWSEIARSERIASSRAQRQGKTHCRRLIEDDAYAQRAARIAHAAIHGSLAP